MIISSNSVPNNLALRGIGLAATETPNTPHDETASTDLVQLDSVREDSTVYSDSISIRFTAPANASMIKSIDIKVYPVDSGPASIAEDVDLEIFSGTETGTRIYQKDVAIAESSVLSIDFKEEDWITDNDIIPGDTYTIKVSKLGAAVDLAIQLQNIGGSPPSTNYTEFQIGGTGADVEIDNTITFTHTKNKDFYNDIVAKIKLMNIGITRYPGGKASNDFNWTTGTSRYVSSGQFEFPVKRLKRWMDDCEIPKVILVVSIFESVATVMSYLQEAADNNVPIEYIVLGNEIFNDGLYFPGDSTDPGDLKELTGTQYADDCKDRSGDTLIADIRTAYPSAELYGIAVAKTGTTRVNNWNGLVRTGLDTLVDGWDIHVYIPDGSDVATRTTEFLANVLPLNAGEKMMIGEYGSKDESEQVEHIFPLRGFLERSSDICVNYVLRNFTDIYSKIDVEPNDSSILFTAQGQEWADRES